MKTTKKKTYVVYTITYFDQIVYVGKTCRYIERKRKHLNQRGTYMSAIPVDADLSKIEFNVVAEFDNKTDALKYEDQLILKYNTIDNGWNKYRSGLVYNDREYVLAHMRDYDAAHREEKAAYNRDYYETHKEERAAYYEANREHIRAQQREYKARKKAEAIASAS